MIEQSEEAITKQIDENEKSCATKNDEHNNTIKTPETTSGPREQQQRENNRIIRGIKTADCPKTITN